jgi:glycosyltransferase involved in cell wall biosynthesis
VKKKVNIPWIVDYRDPWTQIDYFDDLHLTDWARKTHVRLEKSVLNQCDAIVTVGKTMAEDLRKLTSNRIEVITNGFDESDRPATAMPLDDKFTVTYIGTMNDARNPIVLWKALDSLRADGHPMVKEMEIRLVGKPEAVVLKSVSEFDLQGCVRFVGYVSHKEAIDYQNAAHVLLLVINHTTNNASILTGKLFEYLASGRPILCIGPAEGDAAVIIREAGAGVVCDYADVHGVMDFLSEQYNHYLNGGGQLKKADLSRFLRKSLTARLAALLEDLCAEKK